MSKPSTTELDETQDSQSDLDKIHKRLHGRQRTHEEVAKRSGWTMKELEGVLAEDEMLFERELEALIAEKVREAYGRCLDIIDDRKKLLLSSNSKPERWELDMVRRYIEALTPNTPKGE